jgi:hypothetical protein
LYGIDIASFQAGLNLTEVKREGFDFVIAKVTQGRSYVNPDWAAFRSETDAAGMLLVGYHYLSVDPPAAQAENLMSHIGDPTIPVMLDFEKGGGGIDNFWAVLNAITAAGGHVALSYIPHWYWQQIGSPSLAGVPGLVASSYVLGTGYASNLYPGNSSSFWNGYGGAEPVILQFTNQAQVAGQVLDADAFRGSTIQLKQLLGIGVPMTPEQEQQLQDLWNLLLGPNGSGPEQLGGMNLTTALGALLTQLTGTEPGQFNGWPQTGGRTDTDLLSAAAAKLGVPGTFDTKALQQPGKQTNAVLSALRKPVTALKSLRGKTGGP